VDLELREICVVAQFGNHDAPQLAAEAQDKALDQVMGHGPLGPDALEFHGDGAGFGGADEDGQHPLALLLPQEHDRGVGRGIEAHLGHPHRDHPRLNARRAATG
jgi:hypothetical protein